MSEKEYDNYCAHCGKGWNDGESVGPACPSHEPMREQLLVRLDRLLQYEPDQLDELAFERNFRDCQKLYEEVGPLNHRNL